MSDSKTVKTVVNMEVEESGKGQEMVVDTLGSEIQFHRSLSFRFFMNFFYLVFVLVLLIFFKTDYQLATRACQARAQYDQSGQPLGQGLMRFNSETGEKTCYFNWTTVVTQLEMERTSEFFGISLLIWVELTALIFPVWKLTELIFEMFGWAD